MNIILLNHVLVAKKVRFFKSVRWQVYNFDNHCNNIKYQYIVFIQVYATKWYRTVFFDVKSYKAIIRAFVRAWSRSVNMRCNFTSITMLQYSSTIANSRNKYITTVIFLFQPNKNFKCHLWLIFFFFYLTSEFLHCRWCCVSLRLVLLFVHVHGSFRLLWTALPLTGFILGPSMHCSLSAALSYKISLTWR